MPPQDLPTPSPPPTRPEPIRVVAAKDVDLGSRSATETPRVTFVQPDEHDDPLIVLRCSNPVGTCLEIKSFLLLHRSTQMEGMRPETLRIDDQELHLINTSTEGTLLYLDRAAYFPLDNAAIPISILALLMPRDNRVRWFYSLAPVKSLLERLIEMKYISLQKALYHNPDRPRTRDPHARLYVYIRESFLAAFKVPEHPDYVNAMKLTDYAPDILEPETAYRRLEGNDYLRQNYPLTVKDPGDDRYVEEVEGVEVELASQIELGVAEYLFIKRNFFKEFYEAVYRSDKKIEEAPAAPVEEGGRRPKDKRNVVRTDAAHIGWLRKAYHWNDWRARRLVTGWRVLGLLEEGRMVPWIQKGGMLVENFRRAEGKIGDGEKDGERMDVDDDEDGEDPEWEAVDSARASMSATPKP